MGCKGSKNDVLSNVDVIPSEAPEQPINMTEIKGKIAKLMGLKDIHKLVTYEKYGLERSIETAREKIVELSAQQMKMKENYDFLLKYSLQRDADDVYRALDGSHTDKRVLIEILTARTKWQLELICQYYEFKYNVPLLEEIRKNLKTALGRLTGSQTGLGQLMLYITTDQPERDARLLKLSLKDHELLIEVILCHVYVSISQIHLIPYIAII